MAMVVDEYGSLEGLVTPTDILTGIAGDLPDQGDDGRRRARSSARTAPGCSTAACRSTPRRASSASRTCAPDDYATLAGMIIEELGHIPEPGRARRPSHGWCFEVVDLDGRRIDKVLARRPDADVAPGQRAWHGPLRLRRARPCSSPAARLALPGLPLYSRADSRRPLSPTGAGSAVRPRGAD